MPEEIAMKRRTALKVIVGAGAAATVSGAGTYAYMSDEESIDSMFEVGSLIIDVSPEGGELNFESMGEGEENTSSINICNEGSLPIRDIVVTGVDLEGSTEVASSLELLSATYGGEDVLSSLHNGDQNGNGILDLHDMALYLNSNNVSLESEVSGGGLNSSDEENECKLLEITTKMDYSVLPDGENNRAVTASINIVGDQQSYNSGS